MAAKKGIKAKIVAWLEANPLVPVTGRELEQMYMDHGGAVNGPNYSPSRRGRVAHDTMKGLMGSLPIKRVSDGPRGRGGVYGQTVERATFVFDPLSKRYKPTKPPAPSTNPDGSWVDSP